VFEKYGVENILIPLLSSSEHEMSIRSLNLTTTHDFTDHHKKIIQNFEKNIDLLSPGLSPVRKRKVTYDFTTVFNRNKKFQLKMTNNNFYFKTEEKVILIQNNCNFELLGIGKQPICTNCFCNKNT
jgi:hypothetical protein